MLCSASVSDRRDNDHADKVPNMREGPIPPLSRAKVGYFADPSDDTVAAPRSVHYFPQAPQRLPAASSQGSRFLRDKALFI